MKIAIISTLLVAALSASSVTAQQNQNQQNNSPPKNPCESQCKSVDTKLKECMQKAQTEVDPNLFQKAATDIESQKKLAELFAKADFECKCKPDALNDPTLADCLKCNKNDPSANGAQLVQELSGHCKSGFDTFIKSHPIPPPPNQQQQPNGSNGPSKSATPTTTTKDEKTTTTKGNGNGASAFAQPGMVFTALSGIAAIAISLL